MSLKEKKSNSNKKKISNSLTSIDFIVSCNLKFYTNSLVSLVMIDNLYVLESGVGSG